MRKKVFLLTIYTVVSVVLFSACTPELSETTTIKYDDGNTIGFNVKMECVEDTRGLPYDQNEEDQRLQSIMLTTLRSPVGTNWHAYTPSTFMYKHTVTAANSWKTDYSWPGAASLLSFFAYGPHDAQGVVQSSATQAGAPILNYTLPENAVDQKDLVVSQLIGQSGAMPYSEVVDLTFQHVMAQVKVEVGGLGMPGGKIDSVRFVNVFGAANYYMGDGADASGNTIPSGWANLSTPGTFSATSISINGSQDGEPINKDEKTFMMIPQTLPRNALLEVKYNGGRLFTDTIGGDTWKEGETYVYSVNHFEENFSTPGTIHTFTPTYKGVYRIECWGASGNDAFQGRTNPWTQGGRGAYVRGDLELDVTDHLYIYVGERGANVGNTTAWNGGGKSYVNTHWGYYQTQGGGGATDIRLSTGNGNWDDFASLKTRIMVAGAGAGGTDYENGGNACALYETEPLGIFPDGDPSYGAAQTHGGTNYQESWSNVCVGKFGMGGTGIFGSGQGHYGGAGGGSGYYGGSGGVANSAGTGGSSFISGHTGCNAILDAESTSIDNIVHSGQPNHYSGVVFTNTRMRSGSESQPAPGGGTQTGHSGNGYCRITLIKKY